MRAGSVRSSQSSPPGSSATSSAPRSAGGSASAAAARSSRQRGRWFHLSPERLDRAEHWFARYGDWAVFVGRVTPLARSFVSIPAGVFESPFRRYNVLTLAGNAIWCVAFAAAGWALGASWDTVHRDFRFVDYLVVLAAIALVVLLVVRLRRRSRGTISQS